MDSLLFYSRGFFIMRTKASVEAKWKRKYEELKIKTDFRYSVLLKNKRVKLEHWLDREKEKLDRKKSAYMKKKELEYKRKCANEIRELDWRPKRTYKTEWPKINPLQFAMEIAQENARLRDSDADGNWRCISCDWFCSWQNHAWGHRYSRRFQTCCLEEENINLQCHSCNWTTWPRWDSVAKERVNNHYDENIEKKFWPWTVDKLKKKVSDYFQGKAKKYDLKKKVPQLIEKNEKLWKTKTFYSPKRKWRSIWEEYDKRH